MVEVVLLGMSYKNKKREKQTETTLETRHKRMLQEIDQDKKRLPEKKKQLQTVINKLNKLHKKYGYNFDEEVIDQVHTLEMKQSRLEREINEIESKTEENYYNNTGDLLFQYYESFKNIECEEDPNSNSSVSSEEEVGNRKSILNYLSGSSKSNSVQHQRKQMLNNYLERVDKNFMREDIKNENYKKCADCGRECTLNSNESLLECHHCGRTTFIYIDCDKPSYKDPPPEQSNYAYKEINHFKEWLAYAQAKESTEIPSHIYNLILLEIKKNRIKNMAKLTKTHIRGYLKKLKQAKYYEHAPLILMKLTNIAPLRFSDYLEKRLIDMFTEVLMVYRHVKPDDRTNFFSYSYILYKFLELLGYDDYKNYFALFKGNENLKKQDRIFSKICEVLRWQFIPSI